MNTTATNLARAEASMDSMRRALANARDRLREGLQLSRTQSEILFMLMEGPTTTRDIAVRLFLTQGAVTQTIDTLVRRGLVGRHAVEHDRRVVRLELTAEGHDLTTHLREMKRRYMDTLLSSLSEQEIEALIVICERLTEMFNQTEKIEL
jgi:DNA-binding MarR family transcriptional regulator